MALLGWSKGEISRPIRRVPFPCAQTCSLSINKSADLQQHVCSSSSPEDTCCCSYRVPVSVQLLDLHQALRLQIPPSGILPDVTTWCSLLLQLPRPAAPPSIQAPAPPNWAANSQDSVNQPEPEPEPEDAHSIT